jgi:hypothetical protein
MSEWMMAELPGVNMSIGTHGAAVAEAAAERSQSGKPADPVMRGISTANSAIEKGVAAAIPKPVDDALDQIEAAGEQKVGEIIGTRAKK